jgi:WD40 repeat protein
LKLEIHAAKQRVQLGSAVTLRSSGAAEGANENRPYFWSYTNVRAGTGAQARRYPPCLVRYRLDPFAGPRQDFLAQQNAGMGESFRFLFGAGADRDHQWELSVGLRPTAGAQPRLALMLRDGDSPQLSIVAAHIRANSPLLRLYRGRLESPDRPPQDEDLAASTTASRFAFVSDEETASTAAHYLLAELNGDGFTVQPQQPGGDSPSAAVTLLLPGPLAGIDGSVPPANSPPSAEDAADAGARPPVWRLQEGRTYSPLATSHPFQWDLSSASPFAELVLKAPPENGPPLGGTATVATLPWVRMGLGQDNAYFGTLKHRNLVQQVGEAAAAREDRIVEQAPDPLRAAEDFHRAFDDDQSDATTAPFALSGPTPASQPLQNLLPGAKFVLTPNGSAVEPKVGLALATALEPAKMPELTLLNWPNAASNRLAPRRSGAMDRPAWLEGNWRWRTGATPHLQHQPEDGAAVRSSASAIPPVFRHPGITTIVGAVAGEVPWVVFATDDNSLWQWFPLSGNDPSRFGGDNFTFNGEVCHVAAEKIDTNQLLAIGTSQEVILIRNINVNLENNRLEFSSSNVKRSSLGGQRCVNMQFGQFSGGSAAFLLVGATGGTVPDRLVRFHSLLSGDISLDTEIVEFTGKSVQDFTYWFASKNALIAVAFSDDSLELLTWEDQTDLNLASPTRRHTLRRPEGVSRLGRLAAWISAPANLEDPLQAIVVAPATLQTNDTGIHLRGWTVNIGENSGNEGIESEPLAGDLQAVIASLPTAFEAGPLFQKGLLNTPPFLFLFGQHRPGGDDVPVRLSLGLPHQPLGIGRSVVGAPVPGRIRTLCLFGKVPPSLSDGNRSPLRRLSSNGGLLGASGGDDGSVRLWDVSSGDQLASTTVPDGAMVDNAGVLRSAPVSARTPPSGSRWHVERLSIPAAGGPRTCLSITTPGPAVVLDDNGSPPITVQLFCDGLKLEQVDGSNTAWRPLSDPEVASLWPGQFGVFGSDGPIPAWPVVHGLPVAILNVEKIEFDGTLPPDGPLGPVSAQPLKLVFQTVLVNPADLPEVGGELSLARIQAGVEEARSRSAMVRLEFNRDSVDEDFSLISVSGGFFWRFSLSSQATTSFSDPAFSGRLAWLTGSVVGNREQLTVSPDKDESRILVLGALRPLIDAPSLRVQQLDGRVLVREESVPNESLREHRRLVQTDPAAPSATGSPVAAELLSARDRLLGMTAAGQRLQIHDVESGRLEKTLSARIVGTKLLPVPEGAQFLEAVVLTADGTAWIVRLVQQETGTDATSGNPTTTLTPVANPIVLRLSTGFRPASVDVAEVNVPGGKDQVLLIHGEDGTAQLWSRRQGRRLHVFGHLDGTAVSAVALGPQLPKLAVHLLASGDTGLDFFTLAIGRSDGSTRVYAYRLGTGGEVRIDLVRTVFEHKVAVTSVSLATNGTRNPDKLFLLSCAERDARPVLRELVAGESLDEFEEFLEGDEGQELAETVAGKLVFHTSLIIYLVTQHSGEWQLRALEHTKDAPVNTVFDPREVVAFDASPVNQEGAARLTVWLESETHTSDDFGHGAGKLRGRFRRGSSATPDASFGEPGTPSPDFAVSFPSLHGSTLGNFLLAVEEGTDKPGLRLWHAPTGSGEGPNQLKEFPLHPALASLTATRDLAGATSCRVPGLGVLFRDPQRRLQLWDPADAGQRPMPGSDSEGPLATAYVNGELYLAQADHHAVRVWNAATQAVVREVVTSATVEEIDFLENDDRALLLIKSSPTTSPANKSYQLWSISDLEFLRLDRGSEFDASEVIDVTLIRSRGKAKVAFSHFDSTGLRIRIADPGNLSDTSLQTEADASITIHPAKVRLESKPAGADNVLLALSSGTGDGVNQSTSVWRNRTLVPDMSMNNVRSAALDPGLLPDGEARLLWADDVTEIKRRVVEQGSTRDAITLPGTPLALEVVAAFSNGSRPCLLVKRFSTAEQTAVEEMMVVAADTAAGAEAEVLHRLVLSEGTAPQIDTRLIPAVATVTNRRICVWDREWGKTVAHFAVNDDNFAPLALLSTTPAQTSLVAVGATTVRETVLHVGRTGEPQEVPGGESVRAAVLVGRAGVVRLATDGGIIDYTPGAATFETLPQTAGATVLAAEPSTGVWAAAAGNTIRLFLGTPGDPVEFPITGGVQALALLKDSRITGGRILAASDGVSVTVFEIPNFAVGRSFTLQGGLADPRLALADTPDGPRVLLGSLSDGTAVWRVLSFRGLLRVLAGSPPLFDLTARLGKGQTINAQVTPGRRVELRFHAPQSPPVWMGEGTFHAAAEIVDSQFYGFQVERVDADPNGSAHGVLALWALPDGENFSGALLLEKHDIPHNAKVTLGGAPSSFSGPRILLTGVRFDTTSDWSGAQVEQRTTWLLESPDSGDAAMRLLIVDQPLPADNTTLSIVAQLSYRRGKAECHGSLPLEASIEGSEFELKSPEDAVYVLMNARKGPVVATAADIVFPSGRTSRADSIRLVTIDSSLLARRAASTVEDLGKLTPPVFTRWSEDGLQVITDARLPIDLVSDPDLLRPLATLPLYEPALSHRSGLSAVLRVALSSELVSFTQAGGTLAGIEDGLYVLAPVLKLPSPRADLHIPVGTVATQEPFLSRWDFFQTENLFALLMARSSIPATPARSGAVLPLSLAAASARVVPGSVPGLISPDEVRRARLRFGTFTALVRRVLKHAGTPQYEFVSTGLSAGAGQRLPSAPSADVGLDSAQTVVIERDIRRLDPPEARASSQITILGTRLQPQPTRYAGLSPTAGSDTRRALQLRWSSDASDDFRGSPSLSMQLSTAFRPRWAGRTPVLPQVSLAENRAFLPLDLQWQAGVTKPGALQHLVLRPVTSGGDGVTAAGMPLDLALREPQCFDPPPRAGLRIDEAKRVDGQDRWRLDVKWTETLGVLEVPSAPPGEIPAVQQEDGPPESFKLDRSTALKCIALTERFEDALIALPGPGVNLFAPQSSDATSAQLYIVSTFDLTTPLTDPAATPFRPFLVVGPSGGNRVLLPVDLHLQKIHPESDGPGPFVFVTGPDFWKAVPPSAAGAGARLNIVWLGPATLGARPLDQPVPEGEFAKAADLLLYPDAEAPELRLVRPAGIPATLAAVGRYPGATIGVADVCEATLAFGLAATNNGPRLQVQAANSSFALVATGRLQLVTPKLGNEIDVKHVFLLKYFAAGQVIYDDQAVQ